MPRNTIEKINAALIPMQFEVCNTDQYDDVTKELDFKCLRCDNIIHVLYTTLSRRKPNKCCPTCDNFVSITKSTASLILLKGALKQKALIDIEQIEQKRNGICLSKDEYTSSHDMLQWQCNTCQHKWLACLTNVKNHKSWCPQCAACKSETYSRAVLAALYPEYKFVSCRPDFLLSDSGRNLELDMYCEELGLCLEYMGIQHYQFDKFMHNNDPANFESQKARDAFKAEKCEEEKITLVYIPYTVNYQDPKELKKFIYENTVEHVLRMAPDAKINREYLESDVIDPKEMKLKAFSHHQKLMEKELTERGYFFAFEQSVPDAATPICIFCNTGHTFTATLDTLRRKRSSGKKSGCYHCEPRAHGYSLEMYQTVIEYWFANIKVTNVSDPQIQRRDRRIQYECNRCNEEFVLDIRTFDTIWANNEALCQNGCKNLGSGPSRKQRMIEKIKEHYQIEDSV